MVSMTSTELVPVDAIFSDGERVALLGFLAAYQGATREAYASDLRPFSTWCTEHHLRLFGAHRVDIEYFARDLEARVARVPRWHAGSARSPGSTATPKRKVS